MANKFLDESSISSARTYQHSFPGCLGTEFSVCSVTSFGLGGVDVNLRTPKTKHCESLLTRYFLPIPFHSMSEPRGETVFVVVVVIVRVTCHSPNFVFLRNQSINQPIQSARIQSPFLPTNHRISPWRVVRNPPLLPQLVNEIGRSFVHVRTT
jgi:hypothetical protein